MNKVFKLQKETSDEMLYLDLWKSADDYLHSSWLNKSLSGNTTMMCLVHFWQPTMRNIWNVWSRYTSVFALDCIQVHVFWGFIRFWNAAGKATSNMIGQWCLGEPLTILTKEQWTQYMDVVPKRHAFHEEYNGQGIIKEGTISMQ